MSETPSHAKLVAAIEQARETLERQTVTRTDSGFPHPPQVANFGVAAAVDAHLAVLTDILKRHRMCGCRDHDCTYCRRIWPCPDVATVTTALRNMGAL